jgi:predicted small lipoprotein YifL
MIGRILVAAAVVTAAACGGDDPHLTPDAAVLPDATPDAASPRAVAIQFSPTVGTAAFACG